MGITVLDIEEDFFSSFQTSSSKLSILLGMDSFCYAISDHLNRLSLVRKLRFPAGMAAAIPSIEAAHPLLGFPFYQVHIALATPNQVLVPNRLYRAGQEVRYLSHGVVPSSTTVTQADFLAPENAWLLYDVQDSVDTWINTLFPVATRQHLHTALYTALHSRAKGVEYFLVAHIWEENMVVFLFQEERLVFQNSFACSIADDFLYFLLLVCRQFRLRPERLHLHLSGGVALESAIYTLLHRYFFEISFVDLTHPLDKGRQAQPYPAHFFNDVAILLGSSN